MSRSPAAEKRTIALYPTHRGFGYVVFEGPERLIDWGGRHVSGEKNKASLEAASELIDLYHPQILVLEKTNAKGSRKRRRVRELLDTIETHAAARGLTIRRCARETVRQTFLSRNIHNKDQIGRCIAVRFPEMAHHLPPERKPWMSEALRMATFSAAALALTFFSIQADRICLCEGAQNQR